MANDMRDTLTVSIENAKKLYEGDVTDLSESEYVAECLLSEGVVPVLRCKDCRYAEWIEDPFLECKHYFCRLNVFCNVDEDEYCSKGKKRVEDV